MPLTGILHVQNGFFIPSWFLLCLIIMIMAGDIVQPPPLPPPTTDFAVWFRCLPCLWLLPTAVNIHNRAFTVNRAGCYTVSIESQVKMSTKADWLLIMLVKRAFFDDMACEKTSGVVWLADDVMQIASAIVSLVRVHIYHNSRNPDDTSRYTNDGS